MPNVMPFIKPQRQVTRETVEALRLDIIEMKSKLQEFEQYALRWRGEMALLNNGAGCVLENESRAVRDNLNDLLERLTVGVSYITR